MTRRSRVRGNPKKLRGFARWMKEIPKTLAQDVAAKVAPLVTDRARSAYTAGRTVYGEQRPAGVQGNELDLVVEGKTLARVRFVAIGTVVRCVLGTRYSRYLIGKYKILPVGKMPYAWARELDRVAIEEINRRARAL